MFRRGRRLRDTAIIRDLVSQDAKIDIYGVGERLITAKSEPVFGGVYKLMAVEENGEIVPRIKLSENVEKVKVISYSLALAIKENVGYLLYKMNREQIISLYDESKIRENEYKGTDKEIQSFTNYYYKSLKGQLLKGRDPSFFVSKNEENQSKLLEEDEERDAREVGEMCNLIL